MPDSGKLKVHEFPKSIHLYSQGVVALACHPTAPLIYTGCLDGVLRLWDLRTGDAHLSSVA